MPRPATTPRSSQRSQLVARVLACVAVLVVAFVLTTLMDGAVSPRSAAPVVSTAPVTDSPRPPATVPATVAATFVPPAMAAPGPTAAPSPRPLAMETSAAAPTADRIAAPLAVTSPSTAIAESSPVSATSTAHAAAEVTAGRLAIVNAGDEGVRLRPGPGSGDAQKVLRDGASVTALGETQEAAGRSWRPVRDDSGTEGWIAADFLAPVSDAAAAATSDPSPAPTSPAPTQRTSTTASAAGRALPGGGACPTDHPIKGNIAATGERIYHLPSGAFYARTYPEACFASENEARAAGFRRSLR